MGPGSWSRVTNGLTRATDLPGRSESLAGAGYGDLGGGTLTTRRLALPGLAVAAVVAGLQALIFHHRGHGRRCEFEDRPRLSARGTRAGGPRARGLPGSRLSARSPGPTFGRQPRLLECVSEPWVKFPAQSTTILITDASCQPGLRIGKLRLQVVIHLVVFCALWLKGNLYDCA